MQIDFQSEYEKVASLHKENRPWSQLESGLKRLKNRARESHDLEQAAELENRIKDERREEFERVYAEYEEKLLNGEIQNTSELNEYIRELQELAEPSLATLRDRIFSLRDRWRNLGKLKRLRTEIDDYLDSYNNAIIGGMDPADAAKDFLEPAENHINNLMLEMGDSPETRRLLADVRKAIKDADQTAKITNAVTAQFKALIDDLRADNSNNPHIVYDTNGHVRGTFTRDEAIDWYIQEAEKYASDKTDEYLQKAQQYVNRGEYPLASYILDAVDVLYMLPEDKKQEVQDFRDQHIRPQLARINNAREKLKAVRNAPNLQLALDYFNEALSPEQGWPDFESLDKQREQAKNLLAHEYQDDGGHGESSIVGDAREYLYTAMANELQRWENQEDLFTNGHRLIFQLSEEEINDLEYYIGWGDGRLNNQYGRLFNLLKENFYRQIQERAGLLEAAQHAKQHIANKNYKAAYDSLHSYATIIEHERNAYRQQYDLWVEAQAVHGIWQIREEVDATIQSGFDAVPFRLPEEIERVRGVLEKAQEAQQRNPTGANDTGLSQVNRHLQDMLNLIEALYCASDNRISEAIAYLEPSVKRLESPFYAEINERLAEWRTLIVGGEAIKQAIEAAELSYKRGDLRAAYQILNQQIDKVNYEGYQDLVRLLEDVKYELGEQLKDDIQNNIVEMPDSPFELEKLAALLEEINPLTYETYEPQIIAALQLQRAFYTYQKAENTSDLKLWRDAKEAWQQITAAEHRDTLYTVLEAYTIVLTNIELDRTENPNDMLANMRERLRNVLSEIDTLASTTNSNRQVSVLRVRIWMRIVELEEAPHHARTALQSVQHALNACPADIRQTPLLNDVERRIKIADEVLAATDRITHAAKENYNLEQWETTINHWKITTGGLEGVHFGMMLWYQNKMGEVVNEMENNINNAREHWYQAEPIALIYLITGNLDSRELDQQYQAVKRLIEQSLNDYKGELSIEGDADNIYLERLRRAAYALRFIFYTRERDTSSTHIMDYGQELDDLDSLIKSIERKHKEVADVFEIIARAEERLIAAAANGKFDAAKRELDRIVAPNAEYGDYANHAIVIKFNQRIQQDIKERQRLQDAANEVNRLVALNHFLQALQILEVLKSKGAEDFLAENMLNVVDEFAEDEVLYNAYEVGRWIEERQKEIDDLLNWLAPLVDRAKLLKALYPVDGQPPIPNPIPDFNQTRIINFVALEIKNIEPMRSTRQYVDALQELDQIEFGGVIDENHPAENYRGGNLLSLDKAYAVLQKPPYDDEAMLHSRLSIAIFRWAVKLWEILAEQFEYAEQLRNALIRSNDEFPKERQKFNDAFKNLKQGVGKKQDNLRALHSAYKKIRGNGSASGRIERDDIYPLAHNYTGLDQQYNEYKDQIGKQIL